MCDVCASQTPNAAVRWVCAAVRFAAGVQHSICRQQALIAEMTRAIRRVKSLDKSGANPRQHIVAAIMYITSSIYSAACPIVNAAAAKKSAAM